ncbi:mitochondrial carrier protein, putative [Plasmodium reichenowi]|uniref:Mitochondrial carrier protein, putative n=1 Tax=Plasmodium reichenowi TaxID=5854 RepID=A0A151LW73_PLARE|nr:mitochondrial carrier protein, putative [Plasmodium reichenowi]KYO03413.1 mitochondrial carrier protein, putative [Plasmodium reichenowi]
MDDEDNKHIVFDTFMGSIIGCTISKIILYPLDTIKINKQIYKQPIEKGNNEYKKNLLTYIQIKNKNKNTIFLYNFIKTYGFKDLYKGFTFSSLTTIPATCLYFCCFEYLKLKKLQYNNVFQEKGIINDKSNKNDDLNFISYFSLAFLSEAISCIIFVPIDVIKERLQAQKYLQLKEHKTTSKLIKEYIYKQGLSRLYRGYISTCLSYGMFCGSFFFFQSIGHKIMNQLDIESSHYNNLKLNLACSFISGFISSPLDIIRIRFQLQEKDKTFFYYKNFMDGLKKLCREDNRRIYNLFKGNFYRCCLLSLSMTINVSVIEMYKKYMISKKSQ